MSDMSLTYRPRLVGPDAPITGAGGVTKIQEDSFRFCCEFWTKGTHRSVTVLERRDGAIYVRLQEQGWLHDVPAHFTFPSLLGAFVSGIAVYSRRVRKPESAWLDGVRAVADRAPDSVREYLLSELRLAGLAMLKPRPRKKPARPTALHVQESSGRGLHSEFTLEHGVAVDVPDDENYLSDGELKRAFGLPTWEDRLRALHLDEAA